MPSDASIYSLIRPQAITPLENPQDIQAKRMRLQQLMGAQEMQDLQLGEARRGVETGRRIQDLFTANPNAGPDQIAPIDYAAAQKLRQQQLEAEAKRATIKKDTSAAGKSDFETQVKKLEHGAALLDSARDQASYDMALEIGRAAGIFPPDAKFPPQYNPETVKALQSAGMTQAQKLADQRAREGQAITMRGQDLTDSRTRAEGAAGRAVTMRGQNLTDARAKEASATGRIPPGYRATADGGLEATPGGPADAKEEKKVSDTKKVVDMYVAARDGVMSGLEGSATGPIVGRQPAFTAKQQIAEGSVAAMAPVLKQLFRVAGEGVFTDRDQALLLDMVPKRTDEPEARKVKMTNIDKIVAAKLGMEVPQRAGASPAPATGGGRGKFLGFE